MATTRTLTRYNAWANALMFKSVADLPPGEAVKERPSLFKNMIHTLNNNYIVATIWRAHLEGREHGFKEAIPQVILHWTNCGPPNERWTTGISHSAITLRKPPSNSL
jgi:uncharacterized damage-inducible protein DinB